MSYLPKRPSSGPTLTIANEYLHGELPAPEAASRLRKEGPLGNLLAGEVLLDQAARGEKHMASTLLKFAESRYQAVISQTDSGSWRDGYDHAGSRARANMRLAQFNAAGVVYSKRMLPGKPTVKGMYRKLLSQAVELAADVRSNHRDKLDSALEVKGVLGEMAVLLLAQRYALREIGCEEWLPLQSLFSEDSGGDCLTESDTFAWDLDILTPAVGGPETTYALQIKTFDRGEIPRGPTVNITPDLRLTAGERWVESKIIAACDYEAHRPRDDKNRISHDLDTRTEGLLVHFD